MTALVSGDRSPMTAQWTPASVVKLKALLASPKPRSMLPDRMPAEQRQAAATSLAPARSAGGGGCRGGRSDGAGVAPGHRSAAADSRRDASSSPAATCRQVSFAGPDESARPAARCRLSRTAWSKPINCARIRRPATARRSAAQGRDGKAGERIPGDGRQHRRCGIGASTELNAPPAP